jgi:N-acetylmuramoyl-L-alanine amidase
VNTFLLGDHGLEVHDIQQRLVALGERIEPGELDGTYGPSTERAVRAFQDRRSLRVDGRVGPDTWGQLVEASYRLGDRTLYLRAPLQRGDDVRSLQRKLNALGFDAGKEDGLLGARTDHAIREFQRNVGQGSDGIVGEETLTTLERLRPSASGPSRAIVREEESVRSMRSSIEGQVIAIDLPKGEAMSQMIGGALADELSAAGAKPVMLHADDADVAPSTSARSANELSATVCVSLHLPATSGEAGMSCSYFGNATTHSPAGEHIAELIVAAIERNVGYPASLGRLTDAILRETRMPAVQVELPQGVDPAAAKRIGRAIAEGLSRFFEG